MNTFRVSTGNRRLGSLVVLGKLVRSSLQGKETLCTVENADAVWAVLSATLTTLMELEEQAKPPASETGAGRGGRLRRSIECQSLPAIGNFDAPACRCLWRGRGSKGGQGPRAGARGEREAEGAGLPRRRGCLGSGCHGPGADRAVPGAAHASGRQGSRGEEHRAAAPRVSEGKWARHVIAAGWRQGSWRDTGRAPPSPQVVLGHSDDTVVLEACRLVEVLSRSTSAARECLKAGHSDKLVQFVTGPASVPVRSAALKALNQLAVISPAQASSPRPSPDPAQSCPGLARHCRPCPAPQAADLVKRNIARSLLELVSSDANPDSVRALAVRLLATLAAKSATLVEQLWAAGAMPALQALLPRVPGIGEADCLRQGTREGPKHPSPMDQCVVTTPSWLPA